MRDGGAALRARVTALVHETCRQAGHSAPLVVEAGCGARSHLTYPAGARLVGVDTSHAQLRRNRETSRLVVGDAARLPLGTACGDVVVAWDVLEHLARPESAIGEFVRVVRPGGLVVLGLPHVLSLKGIVTRLTPWWVHVWVYRRVLGDPTAGTETSDQFPTTLRLSLRPSALRRRAGALGLEVLLLETYEGPVTLHFRRRHPTGGILVSALGAVSRVLTLGRYDTTASDMVVVLRRRDRS